MGMLVLIRSVLDRKWAVKNVMALPSIICISTPCTPVVEDYTEVFYMDRLCGLVVRVLGYRSGGPSSIPGTTRRKRKVVGLERGPLSLVSTTEELLDRKVAAPV
jgi:hypothetical protein